MDADKILTEAQRVTAYQQAIRNYADAAKYTTSAGAIRRAAPQPKPAAETVQAAPRRAAAPQQPAARSASEPQTPRRTMKHEFLSMLHARSNSGAVRIKDVSRVFDELTRGSMSAAR